MLKRIMEVDKRTGGVIKKATAATVGAVVFLAIVYSQFVVSTDSKVPNTVQINAKTKEVTDVTPEKESPQSNEPKQVQAESTPQQSQASQPQSSNSMEVTVLEVNKADTLTGPLGTKTGPFLIVKMRIKNLQQGELHIVGFGLKVKDTQGNIYDVNEDGMGILFHNRVPTFHMVELDNEQSKTASVVFSFPKEAEPSAILIKPHGNYSSSEFSLK